MKTLTIRLNENQEIKRAIYNTKNSEWKNHKRMLKRVKTILEYEHSYFFTFTIAPKNYDLKIDTYKRKIKEALAGASQWVANIDYGKDNGRLHFHALVGFDFQVDYTKLLEIYNYGAIKIRDIQVKNAEALRNYMIKLTLHAEKDTANEIFYSRKRRKKQ